MYFIKKLLILICAFFVIQGCQTDVPPDKESADYEEIEFQVKTEDLNIFEDGIIPWISIKDPNRDIDQLIDKDEIVIESRNVVLLIDYPLNNPVEIEIKADNPEGFTRSQLITVISEQYHRIYKEEEESAQTKTIPLEDREGLINRNDTDGKYGICCHDIDDLDLSVIIVHTLKDGKIWLELYVES